MYVCLSPGCPSGANYLCMCVPTTYVCVSPVPQPQARIRQSPAGLTRKFTIRNSRKDNLEQRLSLFLLCVLDRIRDRLLQVNNLKSERRTGGRTELTTSLKWGRPPRRKPCTYVCPPSVPLGPNYLCMCLGGRPLWTLPYAKK